MTVPGDVFPLYQRAVHSLSEVGAEVVTEKQVDQWAAYKVDRAPLGYASRYRHVP
jgi:hypothetical protein